MWRRFKIVWHNPPRQLRRYSNASRQANEKIEDMEERIENFEKGQTRQRNLLKKEREEQKKYVWKAHLKVDLHT